MLINNGDEKNMNKMSKLFEIGLVPLLVVAMSMPVMAGWGDSGITFGENGEKIDASVDATIKIVYDDDAVILGTFGLKSLNAFGSVADDDNIVINLLEAKDSANNNQVYASLISTATDVTSATEDSTVGVNIMVAGILTEILAASGTGVVIDGALTADNIATTTDEVTGHFTIASNLTVNGTSTLTGVATFTATPIVPEATVDGKYAVVGGDASTGLMVQSAAITSTSEALQTNTFAVAFGAAPVVTANYTEDPGTSPESPWVVSVNATTVVFAIAADKNYSYIAVGARP